MENLKEALKRKKEELGEWTAHNIYLGEETFTLSNGIVGDEFKLNRIIQLISDFTDKPFNELRIFDLACLEGLYGIECARHGAEVVFLDAREVNLEKVEFINQLLGLEKVTYVKDDVRAINSSKYGKFDVVLCLGIFYHLDYPDLKPFIQRMAECSKGLVIFDTHISMTAGDKFEFEGVEYYGKRYMEHRSDAGEDEKERDLWKSIDNQFSYYLTKNSLLRMLTNSGFTSVAEAYIPHEPEKSYNRITLVAKKGDRQLIIGSPQIKEAFLKEIPELSLSAQFKNWLLVRKNFMLEYFRLRTPRFIKDIYKNLFK